MLKNIFIIILAVFVGLSVSAPLLGQMNKQKVEKKQTKEEIPDPDKMIDVDEFVKTIKQVTPKYPEDAKAQNIEGKVFLKVLVGIDGVPRDVRVVKSDAQQLEKAAIESVMQWRFEPAKLKGKPVAVWVVVPFNFALSNKK